MAKTIEKSAAQKLEVAVNNEKETSWKFWIDQLQREADVLKEKLFADFTYQFGWCGEPLFKMLHKIELLRRVLADMAHNEVSFERSYDHNRAQLIRDTLKPYNVKDNSTGELFRVASTWKHEVALEVLEKFYNISNDFKNP